MVGHPPGGGCRAGACPLDVRRAACSNPTRAARRRTAGSARGRGSGGGGALTTVCVFARHGTTALEPRRRRAKRMEFPFGRAALGIVVLALLSGAGLLAGRAERS